MPQGLDLFSLATRVTVISLLGEGSCWSHISESLDSVYLGVARSLPFARPSSFSCSLISTLQCLISIPYSSSSEFDSFESNTESVRSCRDSSLLTASIRPYPRIYAFADLLSNGVHSWKSYERFKSIQAKFLGRSNRVLQVMSVKVQWLRCEIS